MFDAGRYKLGELLEELSWLGLTVRLKVMTGQVIAIVEEHSSALQGKISNQPLSRTPKS